MPPDAVTVTVADPPLQDIVPEVDDEVRVPGSVTVIVVIVEHRRVSVTV